MYVFGLPCEQDEIQHHKKEHEKHEKKNFAQKNNQINF